MIFVEGDPFFGGASAHLNLILCSYHAGFSVPAVVELSLVDVLLVSVKELSLKF